MSEYSELHPRGEVVEELYLGRLVRRADWGAAPPREVQPLKPPASILVCTNTGTAQCRSPEECAKTVRDLQAYHMEKQNMPDILYNFLIGGDGRIYEGRGWNTYAPPAFKTKKEYFEFKSLNIVFIGDFPSNKDEEPPEDMVLARRDLIGYGLEHKYIDKKTAAMWHEF